MADLALESRATERCVAVQGDVEGAMVGELGALPNPLTVSEGSSILITSAPRSPRVWVA